MSLRNQRKDDKALGEALPSPAPTSRPTDMVRLTRNLHICISGSLTNFSMQGDGAAKWSPLEGRHHIMFGHRSSNVADLTTSTNALKNAYIIECRLLQYKSSFPVPIGVTMSCIPHNEVTETGANYAFTCFPHTNNTTPQMLYQADASQSEGFEWRKNYPDYTEANLEKHNVLPVNNAPYLFVHEKHPIIALLRANTELLGSDIDTHAKIDGEWFKISKQVVSLACHTLRQKVLNRINFKDLTQMQVQLQRLDAREWNDCGEILEEYRDEEGISEKACHFMARVELTYEIPNY